MHKDPPMMNLTIHPSPENGNFRALSRFPINKKSVGGWVQGAGKKLFLVFFYSLPPPPCPLSYDFPVIEPVIPLFFLREHQYPRGPIYEAFGGWILLRILQVFRSSTALSSGGSSLASWPGAGFLDGSWIFSGGFPGVFCGVSFSPSPGR